MILRKILPISALIIFISIVGVVGSFYTQFPEIFRCCFVIVSNDFDEIGDNFFVSKDTPGNHRDSLQSLLHKANKRVSEFWNAEKREGNPIIIYCNSKSFFSEYSNHAKILTYKTPLYCYIVFGAEYIDLDMLSHELFHTELCARTGYFCNVKLPTWFDEGLAMQVDYRKEYSEDKYRIMKDSSVKIQISQISEPEQFYSGNYYFHFLLAKHEVGSWLQKTGKEGLQELIHRLTIGEDFNSIYRNLFSKEKYYGSNR
jgi:hypothetical protein